MAPAMPVPGSPIAGARAAVPPAAGTAALLEALLPQHLAGRDEARALCLLGGDVVAALLALGGR